jgi:hypothetical protein
MGRADSLAIDSLNYALTLEHLEDTFYRQGLAQFTAAQFAAAGFDGNFHANTQAIAEHESDHVAFLTGAITATGGSPVAECTYAFGVPSVASFVATAAILEGVGTSAYLGAARQIANKDYLQAAGSILTVEARHSSYIRASLAQTPYPQSYDDALIPNEVYTQASQFITSCPSTNTKFPIKAYPNLVVSTTGKISTGQLISISTTNTVLMPENANAKLYAAFVGPAGPVWALMTPQGDGIYFQVTVPAGVSGQSYLLFNNCDTKIDDSTVVAGPTVLEVASTFKNGNAITKE